ncbi:hypothetical protein [Sphingobium sp. CFD-1]|uniref:hypothetical protein n=1 Tax=Sphingobium sp. CFD-1 TaxID=2878545 RepID=UPI00214ABEDC|nr:hypothetical protein [Sphingobium sp. CFD-1]
MKNLSKKDQQGLWIIVGVVVLMAVAFAGNYRLSNKPKPDERNCISPIVDKTAIILDRSDDTPKQTIDEILSRISGYVNDGAKTNELVSIFEISQASRTGLTPVFEACTPQKDGNDLYENRRAIQRFYKDKFQNPLEKALNRKASISEMSPIAEAVIDLSVSKFLDAKSNKLIIFSDLMQNSENTSIYGCLSDEDVIGNFREKRAGAVERPTFKNTSIQLNIIPREGLGKAAVACRDRFWMWFFGDNSGPHAGLETKYLPGGARVK